MSAKAFLPTSHLLWHAFTNQFSPSSTLLAETARINITSLAQRRAKGSPSMPVPASLYVPLLPFPRGLPKKTKKPSTNDGRLSVQIRPRYATFETWSNRTNRVCTIHALRYKEGKVLMLLERVRAEPCQTKSRPSYQHHSVSLETRISTSLPFIQVIPWSRLILGRAAAGGRRPWPSTAPPDSGLTSAEFAWPSMQGTFAGHRGTRTRSLPEATAGVGHRVDYKQHGRLINRHLPTMNHPYS